MVGWVHEGQMKTPPPDIIAHLLRVWQIGTQNLSTDGEAYRSAMDALLIEEDRRVHGDLPGQTIMFKKVD
jgi:hypothetical protein